MALVRVTPETAVDTVSEQIASFRDTVADAGRAPALARIRDAADDLGALLDSGSLEAELLLLDGIHPTWTAPLASWLGLEPEVLVGFISERETVELDTKLSESLSVVRIRGPRSGAGRRAGERVPPVFIVAHGSKTAPPDEVMEEVLHELKHRPLTLVAAPDGSDWAQALAGLGSRDVFVCKLMKLEEIGQKNLAASLDRPPWKQAAQMASAWSMAGALSSLHLAFSAALEKEERSVKAKKIGLEQASARQGSPVSPTEILGEVRNYLQKRFDAFGKKVSRRMQEIVEPHDGTLSREIEAQIDAFETFEFEKKPKVDVLKIPSGFQKGLLARTREELGKRVRADVLELRDLLRDVRPHVEQLIESKGGPPVALHFQHVQDSTVETILNRSIGYQRPYKGEVSRRGPMDYFMAARRYQMLFFMVFSAFGLSFIRSYREFTIPMGVLLLSFGMLNVVNSARKQRAEAVAKELAKAREALRTDLRRSMSDVQKAWDQLIGNHLAQEQSNALELIESTVKSVAEVASREAAGDKELLQQQLKGLDNSQRKISEGIKKSEVAATDLTTLSEQLIEFYAAMVRPPAEGEAQPGRPGMPGAGAGAVPGVAAARPGIPGAAGGAAGGLAAKPPGVGGDAMAKLEALKKQAGGAAPGAAAGGGKSAAEEAKAKLEALKKKTGGGAAGAAAGAGSGAADDAKARLEALKKKAGGGAAGAAAGAGSGDDPQAKLAAIQAEAAKKLAEAKKKTSGAAAGPSAADAQKAREEAAKKLEELKKKRGGSAGRKPGGGSR